MTPAPFRRDRTEALPPIGSAFFTREPREAPELCIGPEKRIPVAFTVASGDSSRVMIPIPGWIIVRNILDLKT